MAEDIQDRAAGAERVRPGDLESDMDWGPAASQERRLASSAGLLGHGDDNCRDREPEADWRAGEAGGLVGSSGTDSSDGYGAESGIADGAEPDAEYESLPEFEPFDDVAIPAFDDPGDWGWRSTGGAGGRRRRRRSDAFGTAEWAAASGRGTHIRSGAQAGVLAAAEPADGLAAGLLLPSRRRTPAPGWRRTVYQASGGLVRVPTGSAEARRRDMISRARTSVASGHFRVAVLSLKGGVGKTTTTVGLGSTLASLRGDRVIAIDANSDRGTLSDKLALQTQATVRDLLDARDQIQRYADVRAFTSQTASRLEVLASDRDPEVSVAFGEDDYCDASTVLERYYSVCLTDCGTGLLHSAMSGVLRLTDQVVLVSTASVDGAKSAGATLDWLAAHGHGDLVWNAVVVFTAVRKRGRAAVDLDVLEEHFAARCRAVTRVPYDRYLEQGAEVELDQVRRTTADAFLELAAVVGDGFARCRAEPKAIAASSAHQALS